MMLIFLLAVQVGRGVLDYKRMPAFARHTKNLAKDATTLNVERLAEKIVLEKKDGVWTLASSQNYPAQESTVNDILAALGSAELEERVSSRSDRFADFELDDVRSIKFSAKNEAGRVLAAGRMGKQVLGSWDRSYFAPQDASAVYIVKGLPRYQLDKSAIDFKTRVILEAPKDKISSVVIHSGRTTLAIKKDGAAWKVNGKNAKEDKVADILKGLGQFEANDFAEPFEVAGGLKKLGLEKKPSEALVKILMTDGKAYELWIGEKKDTLYFAKLSDRPTIWKLGEWKVTPLKAKEADLVATASSVSSKNKLTP